MSARKRSRRSRVDSQGPARTGHSRIWLAGIVLLAVVLRIAFLVSYSQDYSPKALGALPFLFEPGNIAVSIVHGSGFASPFRIPTGPTAWMPPVYPLLLAGVMKLFGVYTYTSYLVAVGLNIAFVSAATVPLYLVAKEIAGDKVAVGAALLWAVFPNAILIPVESLWDASLSTLLATLILWATLRLAEAPTVRSWALYGLLWGLTLMTNPAIAIVLPVLVVWVLWRARGRAEWQRGLATFATVTMLCCVPWTIRNHRVLHAFVPLRSVLGLPLWLGNNPNAQPRTWAAAHPLANQTERDRYVQLGEIAYMKEKRELAVGYILQNPRRDVELSWRRFLAYWCGGTPYPIDDFERLDSFRFRSILIFNVLVAIGTAVGIVMMFARRNPYRWAVAAFPILFPVVYYVTTVVPRYRLPIDPVLMMLTAIAASGVKFRSGDTENPQQVRTRG